MGDYVQRFMQDQGPLGPHPKHYAGGWIEVICGSMFSGNTRCILKPCNPITFGRNRHGPGEMPGTRRLRRRLRGRRRHCA